VCAHQFIFCVIFFLHINSHPQYHGFTLLMGVALSDCGAVEPPPLAKVAEEQECSTSTTTITPTGHTIVEECELEGQLCVWPGSHWALLGLGEMVDPGWVSAHECFRECVRGCVRECVSKCGRICAGDVCARFADSRVRACA
jgi:hypothetical protein